MPSQKLGGDMDLCIDCGKEVPMELAGGRCEPLHTTVHQQPCTGCGRVIGEITDDDYCGPETLYCPDCMDKFRKKGNTIPDKGHPDLVCEICKSPNKTKVWSKLTEKYWCANLDCSPQERIT